MFGGVAGHPTAGMRAGAEYHVRNRGIRARVSLDGAPASAQKVTAIFLEWNLRSGAVQVPVEALAGDPACRRGGDCSSDCPPPFHNSSGSNPVQICDRCRQLCHQQPR